MTKIRFIFSGIYKISILISIIIFYYIIHTNHVNILYFLNYRPTMIGTEPTLGIGASKEVELFVLLSPVGTYYSR